MIQPLTLDELRALPVVVDVVTTGRALGMSRGKSYALARQGLFPLPLLTLGQRQVATKASLLALLGIEQ